MKFNWSNIIKQNFVIKSERGLPHVLAFMWPEVSQSVPNYPNIQRCVEVVFPKMSKSVPNGPNEAWIIPRCPLSCSKLSHNRITRFPNVFKSVTRCPNVFKSVTRCPNVFKSVTRCPNVSQSATRCPNVSQSATRCPNVSQRVSKYLNVFLGCPNLITMVYKQMCF